MDSGILLIWIGALLIIGGVIYGAALTLRKGGLSGTRQAGTLRTASLEPRQGIRPLSLKTHWPAFALIIVGTILIFARAAF